MNSKTVIYSSRFSLWGLFFFILVTLFWGYMFSAFTYNSLAKNEMNIIDLVIIVFLLLPFCFLIYYLSLPKKIIFTKDFLITESIILGLTKEIRWDSIENAERRFIHGSRDLRTIVYGEELILKTKNGNLILSSFFYKEFPKLLHQFNKRLDSELKKKIKLDFKKKKNTILNRKREEERFYNLYVWYIIAALVAFVIILKIFEK